MKPRVMLRRGLELLAILVVYWASAAYAPSRLAHTINVLFLLAALMLIRRRR